MDLTILFDHRFLRDEHGVLFSAQNYNYGLFARRCLPVFDSVRVIARVSRAPRPRPRGQFAEGPGVRIRSVGDWRGTFGVLRKWRSLSRALKEYLEPGTAVVTFSAGVVGLIASRILAATGRPYAVEVIGDPYDVFSPGAVTHPLRPVLRHWLSAQLRRQCSCACAAAYVTQYTLQRRYPCSGYSAGISNVELPDSAFVSTRRSGRRAPTEFTLVSVGSLAQLYKGPDVLIRAVARCVRQKMSLRLVFLGEGKYRTKLEGLAASVGLARRVQFLGQLPAKEAVRAQLDQADLFVLPSKTEGLPRAMVEAMARGLPCIGSTVGGIPELLLPEDMVPPGDVARLAGKIREVLCDSERMTRMSARNLEKAKEYRLETLAERRVAFYRYLREKTQEGMRCNAS